MAAHQLLPELRREGGGIMSGTYDTCGDDRFELIAKAKQKLLDATNIENRPEEIAVLDSILFRCWQMGWLDRLREGKLLEKLLAGCYGCDECGGDFLLVPRPSYCPLCGTKFKEG